MCYNIQFNHAIAKGKLKIWTAVFTASTSISTSFPVLDDMIAHFFSSGLGTNALAFSSEQNNAILQKQKHDIKT